MVCGPESRVDKVGSLPRLWGRMVSFPLPASGGGRHSSAGGLSFHLQASSTAPRLSRSDPLLLPPGCFLLTSSLLPTSYKDPLVILGHLVIQDISTSDS